jgi:hypothetical protein
MAGLVPVLLEMALMVLAEGVVMVHRKEMEVVALAQLAETVEVVVIQTQDTLPVAAVAWADRTVRKDRQEAPAALDYLHLFQVL